MSNRINRPVLIAFSFMMTSAAPIVAQQAALPSVTLPPALDRVLRDYEREWRASNATELSKLFTQDGFVLQSGKPATRGRDAIATAYSSAAGGALTLRALSFATADTVGFIIGAYTFNPEAGDQGKFTLTLRKGAGGRWLIHSDMDNSSSMPRRVTAAP